MLRMHRLRRKTPGIRRDELSNVATNLPISVLVASSLWHVGPQKARWNQGLRVCHSRECLTRPQKSAAPAANSGNRLRVPNWDSKPGSLTPEGCPRRRSGLVEPAALVLDECEKAVDPARDLPRRSELEHVAVRAGMVRSRSSRGDVSRMSPTGGFELSPAAGAGLKGVAPGHASAG
jgi:hypothetical protein